MRNIERIPVICDRLKAVWSAYPDLRFGQLISNVFRDIQKDGLDLLCIEDDEFILRVEKYFQKNQPNTPVTNIEECLAQMVCHLGATESNGESYLVVNYEGEIIEEYQGEAKDPGKDSAIKNLLSYILSSSTPAHTRTRAQVDYFGNPIIGKSGKVEYVFVCFGYGNVYDASEKAYAYVEKECKKLNI